MFRADSLEVEEARNDTGNPLCILSNGLAFNLDDYPELLGSRVSVCVQGQQVENCGFVSERDGVARCCILTKEGYALYDWANDDYYEARLVGKVDVHIDGKPAAEYMSEHYGEATDAA